MGVGGQRADGTRKDQPPGDAEERLRIKARLLNAVGQAVVAWDLDGRVTYLNAAAETMYGWPAGVAVGSHATDLSGVELSVDQLAGIATTLNEGRSWSGEVTVGRADGTVAPVWVTNTPVVEDGETVGFIGVSLDITERKEAEAQAWHRATHDASPVCPTTAPHRSARRAPGPPRPRPAPDRGARRHRRSRSSTTPSGTRSAKP